MKNLLFVTSSRARENSRSERVARELIAALGPSHTYERRLGDGSIRLATREYLQAVMTAPADRTTRQNELASYGEAYIGDVERADTIVIAALMSHFSGPSTLKAWLDHITQSGRTFGYTAEGRLQGLLKDKKVYVVVSRGGVYPGDSPAKPLDFHESYLRAMLAFIGLKDVSFVHVEGQRIGPAAAEDGLKRARRAIVEIAPLARAA